MICCMNELRCKQVQYKLTRRAVAKWSLAASRILQSPSFNMRAMHVDLSYTIFSVTI